MWLKNLDATDELNKTLIDLWISWNVIIRSWWLSLAFKVSCTYKTVLIKQQIILYDIAAEYTGGNIGKESIFS